MAMAKEMMQGGVSAGAARAINGFQNLTASGAGTTITDATLITAGHTNFTTVASGTGAALPEVEIGDELFVYNAGANQLTVYPSSSTSAINQLPAGTGMLLVPFTSCWFKKASSTAWTANLSA